MDFLRQMNQKIIPDDFERLSEFLDRGYPDELLPAVGRIYSKLLTILDARKKIASIKGMNVKNVDDDKVICDTISVMIKLVRDNEIPIRNRPGYCIRTLQYLILDYVRHNIDPGKELNEDLYFGLKCMLESHRSGEEILHRKQVRIIEEQIRRIKNKHKAFKNPIILSSLASSTEDKALKELDRVFIRKILKVCLKRLTERQREVLRLVIKYKGYKTKKDGRVIKEDARIAEEMQINNNVVKGIRASAQNRFNNCINEQGLTKEDIF